MNNELINEGKSEQIQKQLIKLNNAALSNAENMIQRRINEKFGKAGSFFKVKVFANKEDSSPSGRANPEKSDYGTSLYIVDLMPRNFKTNDKYGKYYKPYAEYHIAKDWEMLRQIIKERSPQYIPAFEKTMDHSNKSVGYNMFITHWKHFNAYSEWLFDILFEVEERTTNKCVL